jgi:hypothetical protein
VAGHDPWLEPRVEVAEVGDIRRGEADEDNRHHHRRMVRESRPPRPHGDRRADDARDHGEIEHHAAAEAEIERAPHRNADLSDELRAQQRERADQKREPYPGRAAPHVSAPPARRDATGAPARA